MFSVIMVSAPVFIMDEEKIFEAKECNLTYNGKSLNFIEKDGLYAYSEFFREGWGNEDEEYEYEGLHLKMVGGGWNESLSNLVQSINHMADLYIEEKDEEEINSFINRLKNGEGENTYDMFELKNY